MEAHMTATLPYIVKCGRNSEKLLFQIETGSWAQLKRTEPNIQHRAIRYRTIDSRQQATDRSKQTTQSRQWTSEDSKRML
jgi:hypothetical protein